MSAVNTETLPMGKGGARPNSGPKAKHAKKKTTTRKPPPEQTADVTDYERYTKARADKEEEMARLKKMEADKLSAELLPAAEVEREWRDMIATVRAGMLAVPSRVAPIVVTMDDEKEIEEAITAALHEAMASIAGCD